MATSIGAGLEDFGLQLEGVKGIALYVTIASTTSALLGALVFPPLVQAIKGQGQQPSDQGFCPPCQCLCASTCVPPAAGAVA